MTMFPNLYYLIHLILQHILNHFWFIWKIKLIKKIGFFLRRNGEENDNLFPVILYEDGGANDGGSLRC